MDEEAAKILEQRGFAAHNSMELVRALTANESQVLGGSLQRTHLVKGLDTALLE